MTPMPEDCNSLVRIDDSLDFCKANCKWSQTLRGRPRKLNSAKVKKPHSNRRIKNPRTICVCLEDEHYEYIRKQAIAKSQQTGNAVNANDLIREALQKQIPCPKLYDMFGGNK